MYQKNSKRKQQASNTREKIFAIAAELMAEKDFEHIKITDITKRAGISTGAFYHHFKSKEELIFELINQVDEIYQKFYDEEVIHVTPENVLELIRRKCMLVLESFSKWGKDPIIVCYSYMAHNESLRERMTNSGRICNLIAYELFTKGQNWGIIRSDISLEALIASHVKTERGALIDWCVQGGTGSILKDSEAIIQLHLDGIKAK